MSVDFDICDWVKPDCMIRLSEIKSGGICGNCACHFESRNFYKLHFLKLNF